MTPVPQIDPRRSRSRSFRFGTAPRVGPWTRVAFLLLAVFAGDPHVAAAPLAKGEPSTLPTDSVRAGMTGYGLSVFRGTQVDSFPMTILGVLKGNRPGADLILAKARGDFLERTGIIAGMSGSPVYIGGKLIGAVAYTWAFTKDPVAGITPIGEMLTSLRSTPEERPEPSDARYGALDLPPGEASPSQGEARPIATPLALSGFTPEALRYLDPWLKEHGFVSAPGGSTSDGGSCDSIVPGSAVGVELVRGDMSATAIGTATYRQGNRVLAYGLDNITRQLSFYSDGVYVREIFNRSELAAALSGEKQVFAVARAEQIGKLPPEVSSRIHVITSAPLAGGEVLLVSNRALPNASGGAAASVSH